MAALILAQGGSPLTPPPIEFVAFAPEMVLIGAALVLLLLAVAGPARTVVATVLAAAIAAVGVWLLLRELTVPGAVVVATGAAVAAATIGSTAKPSLGQVWIAGSAVVGALVLTVWQWGQFPGGGFTALSGALALDGIAFYTRITVLVSAGLVLPIGYGYLLDRDIYRLEYEPLLLFATTGMTVLGAAADLLMVFIAIELLSFSLYILCGLARRDRRSQEASLKYFVLGAVTSAVLAYGIALLYTATGTIDVGGLERGLAVVTTPTTLALIGVALVTVGVAFKAAAVPFHFWTPDVYQGAPTNVTAFMAAATKAAAFAVVLRLFLVAFGRLDGSWVPILAAVATASMLLGAVAAVVQRDVKRVLAYSSIAHVGYALVGVVSASAQGLSSTLYYLLTYAVSAVAAFGCVVAIERRRRGEVALVDLKGLARTAPLLAGIFSLSLLSLAGIPATAGFTGKFAVFRAGVASGLEWLVVIGVVSSVIAAFFYLRLMAAMFLEEPDPDTAQPVLTTGIAAGVTASGMLVLYLGIDPAPLIDLAERAAVVAR